MARYVIVVILIVIINNSKSYGQPELLWTATYGKELIDYGEGIAETEDGGFVFTGSYSDSMFMGWSTFYLAKIDSQGILQWENFPGSGYASYGCAVISTTENGCIAVGRAEDNWLDVHIVKADCSGSVIWSKNYGGNSWDVGQSIATLSDGNYIIGAQTGLLGLSAFYLIKINSSGDTLWTKTFGADSMEYFLTSAFETSDGGILSAGYYYLHGNYDFRVIILKTDAGGDSLWSVTFNDSLDIMCNSASECSQGGFILAGCIDYYGSNNAYILKTNSQGGVIWSRSYNVPGANSIREDYDSGFIVGTNGGILKISPTGDSLWFQPSTGISKCAIPVSAGGYISIGTTADQITDIFIARLSQASKVEPNPCNVLQNEKLYPSHPNPFNAELNVAFTLPSPQFINLTLYNLAGEEVENILSQNCQAGITRYTYHANTLPSGIYFLRLKTENSSAIQKIVYIK